MTVAKTLLTTLAFRRRQLWDDGEIGRHDRLLIPGAGGRETTFGMRSTSVDSLPNRA